MHDSSFRRAPAFASIAVAVFTIAVHANAQTTVRIATFNVSLYGSESGEVARRLKDGMDPQARKIAAIVQTVRPDILLVNEIDYDSGSVTAKLLSEHYFGVGGRGLQPMPYPYVFAVPSNTGVDSGLDLNGNGKSGEPEDAWGYGGYAGQYAMAVYSRYPIEVDGIRMFQRFRWREMPDPLRPVDPLTGNPFYDDAIWNRLRLSSKNHVDVPIRIGSKTIHLLASHPTPPVFDGAEDRNGCRNHDEIRFWHHYLLGPAANYLVDDAGTAGGLPKDALFVIAGDLNSDPFAGDSRPQAIRELIGHPRVHDPKPARPAAGQRAATSSKEVSNLETAVLAANRMLRIDYVLPSRSIRTTRSGVFWPPPGEPSHQWINASDHRMVWIESKIAEGGAE